jgi:hypothetical protein
VVEPLLGDGAEEPHRVVIRLLPEGGIETPEEPHGLGIPAPPEVVGELPQRLELLGKPWDDGEHGDRTHADSLQSRDEPTSTPEAKTPYLLLAASGMKAIGEPPLPQGAQEKRGPGGGAGARAGEGREEGRIYP